MSARSIPSQDPLWLQVGCVLAAAGISTLLALAAIDDAGLGPRRIGSERVVSYPMKP